MVTFHIKKKKMKVLSKAPWEIEGEAYVALPKLKSRIFPVNYVFMGVIDLPV